MQRSSLSQFTYAKVSAINLSIQILNHSQNIQSYLHSLLDFLVALSLYQYFYQNTHYIQDLQRLNYHFRSEKSPIPSKRIQNIIDYLSFAVYAYAARGLYEKDKFMYTLLLSLKIDMEKGAVKHEEFQMLIKGTWKILRKMNLIFKIFWVSFKVCCTLKDRELLKHREFRKNSVNWKC